MSLRTESTIAKIVKRAAEQGNVTREEAYLLMKAEGTDLLELMRLASAIRDQAKGNIVTYSRKVFIPLTNMCRNTCGYCAFVKAPDDPDAHIMSPEEVNERLSAAELMGCKEVLISLGERPELRYPLAKERLNKLGYKRMLDYVYDICRLVIDKTSMIPHTNAGALKYEELKKLKEVNGSMGMMMESINPHLQAHHQCADKVPCVRLNTIKSAGELHIPFTTGILMGIGESIEDRVDSLFEIFQLNKRYGHIQEIIIQNFRAKPKTAMAGSPEPTVWEMVKTIAVGRLIFGGEMNIQAPPNLTPQIHQLFLLAGINDWGGISPLTPDYINPEKPWPQIQDLNQECKELGFTLRERLTIYPTYLNNTLFKHEVFESRVRHFIDGTGFVREEIAVC